MASYSAEYTRHASLLEYLPENSLKWLTQGLSSWLVAFAAGALLPLSFAPFNTYYSGFAWLIFFPVAVFLYQMLHTRSAREAFYKGWLFGIGLFLVGVSWVYVAIHDFGAAHWSLAAFFTALFVLILSVFYGFFGWTLYKLRTKMTQQAGIQAGLMLFYLPVFWVLFEWLRSWVLTGFPWLLAGYPMIATPLAAYAPVTGIYGLSLLVVLLSALLVVRIKALLSLSAIVLIFGGAVLLDKIHWTDVAGEPLSVALIQGNVNQSVKWDRWQLEKTKQLYVSLSQQQWQDNDLIVWPENAIPVFYHTLEKGFYHQLDLQARKTRTELITGLPVFDDDTQQYYNAMTNLGGEQSYYYKAHLVPFGEYVPLAALIRGIVKFFNMPMSGFSAGSLQQAPVKIKGYKAVVTICYEDVFPQDIITQIPQSQFMINLSNNGWYGDSFAPHQHLEMARMRALETGRDLIRSTTSGITALIDYQGRVLAQGPQFTSAVVNGRIQPRTGTTPYVYWGNYPLIVLFALAVVLFWRQMRS